MNATLKNILILAVCALIGFAIGRLTQQESVVIRWKEGPKTTDTIRVPVPVHVEPPPAKIVYDTVFIENPVTGEPEIDTLASLRATAEDWNRERSYAGTLFQSDTLGTLNYSAKVQYNTLASLAWDYTPKIKNVTTTKAPTFRPFIAIRGNTFEQASVGGGMFAGRFGIEASYIKDFKNLNTGFGLGFFVCF